jgi:hypothetical protein
MPAEAEQQLQELVERARSGEPEPFQQLASLIDNDGVTHLVEYSFLGLRSVVVGTLPQPQLQFTLIGTAGGNDRTPATSTAVWTASGGPRTCSGATPAGAWTPSASATATTG